MGLHPPNQQTISLLVLSFLITTSLSLVLDTKLQSLRNLTTINNSKTMSRRRSTTGGDGLKLDLKLNLSPPRTIHWPVTESPNRSSPVTISPTNSCVSLEQVQDETVELRYSSSPETTSMMLAGCPRCLMYVMLAEEYPKCPKCKSTVLLDVLLDKPMKKMRS